MKRVDQSTFKLYGHPEDANLMVCLSVKPEGGPETVLSGQTIRYLNHRIKSLFDAIAHGNAAHRAWLREAINAHFLDQPLPKEPQ